MPIRPFTRACLVAALGAVLAGCASNTGQAQAEG
ncbi:META domain-containing protein, partial [Bordetella pertussis]